MSTNTTKGSALGFAVVAVAVLAVAAVASDLPSRMPPDPFKNDEPRVVVLEVYWEGKPRSQHISYEVGDDTGDLVSEGVPFPGLPGKFWEHVTTAAPGTSVYLSSIQPERKGTISCTIYVNDGLLDLNRSESPGCLASGVIP